MKTLALLLFLPQILLAKPFWTEKSSYQEGDRIYFVGVSTDGNTIEESRKIAFENGRLELMNYLQVSSTDPFVINTQMTFEEKGKGDKFNTYRLMWVEAEKASEYKKAMLETERASREKEIKVLDLEIQKRDALLVKAKEKKTRLSSQQNELKDILGHIDSLTNLADATLSCGMTTSEAKKLLGNPRSVASCSDMTYYNYGKFWAIFTSGVYSCKVSASEYGRCLSCPYKSTCD